MIVFRLFRLFTFTLSSLKLFKHLWCRSAYRLFNIVFIFFFFLIDPAIS